MNTVVFQRVRLRGVSGPYRDSEHFLDKDMFLVGRAPGLDLVLTDRMVSGQHARIVHQADGYWVEDLGSTNGTFVNGTKVDRQRLRTGDRIAFDRIEFVFEDPNDVPRTVMAPAVDGSAAPEKTVSRAPAEAVPGTPRSQAEAQEIPPEPEAPKQRRRRGAGLLLGLVLAFLLGYAGVLAASLAAGGLTGISWSWLRMSAVSYPLLYIHTSWLNMSPGLPFFLGLTGFVLGPLIGGFFARRLGRGSRMGTAMLFAAAYSGLSLLFSLAAAGFRFAGWQRMFPVLLPSGMPGELNIVLGVAVIWAVTFLLALLGSAFSR